MSQHQLTLVANNLLATVTDFAKRPSFRVYLVIMAVSVAIAHLVLRRIFARVTSSSRDDQQRASKSSSSSHHHHHRRSGASSNSSSKNKDKSPNSRASSSSCSEVDAAPPQSSSSKSKRGTRPELPKAAAAAAAAAAPPPPTTSDDQQQHQQQRSSRRSKAQRGGASDEASAPPPNRIFGSGHERLGHVVTVRVKTTDPAVDVAKAAQSFALGMRPPVHVVLSDTAGVQGELRQPTHAALWLDSDKALAAAKDIADKVARRGKKLGAIVGDDESATSSVGTFRLTTGTLEKLARSPAFTMITEKSVRYSLDASRVMFSSGNTTERMHFGVDVHASGEMVVDMFAGIGYFTVPLSVSMSHPARIIAIEKNPESCAYLACNCLLNDCTDRVVILNGDNRQVGNMFVGKCNRVLMGYIPCCKEFLPRAASFLVQHKVDAQQMKAAAAVAAKGVSFAPGSTPPREKQQQGSSGSSAPAAAKKDDADADEEKEEKDDDNDQSSASATTTTTTATSFPPLTTRPVGVIHYHYLSESGVKQHAAATATLHVLESLGPALGSLCSVADVRVVKSYAPKKFHCVADLVFA